MNPDHPEAYRQWIPMSTPSGSSISSDQPVGKEANPPELNPADAARRAHGDMNLAKSIWGALTPKPTYFPLVEVANRIANYRQSAIDAATEELRKENEREKRAMEAGEGIAALAIVRGLRARNAELEAACEQLEEALQVILPMAKGYAAEHRVGCNDSMVEMAQSTLSSLRSVKADKETT